MMGDTPEGVVARRTCPSGVASFGRVIHAPADPRALYEAMRRSLLHQSRAVPGSPKVGSQMVEQLFGLNVAEITQRQVPAVPPH